MDRFKSVPALLRSLHRTKMTKELIIPYQIFFNYPKFPSEAMNARTTDVGILSPNLLRRVPRGKTRAMVSEIHPLLLKFIQIPRRQTNKQETTLVGWLQAQHSL